MYPWDCTNRKGQMKYTRAAVGKGQIPEGQSPKTMTQPAGYVMDAKIASVTNPVNGECQVTVQIDSSDASEGFYATSIMLFATDPDEGEVPYTYLALENEPEWIRPSSSVVGKLATFDLIAAVGAIDKVTAAIDPSSFTTYGAVEQLIDGATLKREITIPTAGWEDAAEEALTGRVYVDIPQEDATEAMMPVISLYPTDAHLAKACGMSETSRTLDGKVRVYAEKAPSEEIKATLVLMKAYSGRVSGGEGNTSYVLPAATKTRLGGVKIGDNIEVTPDGTISSSGKIDPEMVATEDETEEMITKIFDEN